MAKTLDQTVMEAVQTELGRLTVQNYALTAALNAARDEIESLKAEIAKSQEQADNTAEPPAALRAV